MCDLGLHTSPSTTTQPSDAHFCTAAGQESIKSLWRRSRKKLWNFSIKHYSSQIPTVKIQMTAGDLDQRSQLVRTRCMSNSAMKAGMLFQAWTTVPRELPQVQAQPQLPSHVTVPGRSTQAHTQRLSFEASLVATGKQQRLTRLELLQCFSGDKMQD